MVDFAKRGLVYSNNDIDELWKRFVKKYPTEKSCLKAICRILIKVKGFKCGGCGSTEFKRSKSKRLLYCRLCNYYYWYTSGTFFERVHQVRPYFAALWFYRHGVVITSTKFKELTGQLQSTSWIILKKVAIAVEKMTNDSESNPLCISVFKESIYKRSTLTPAQLSPHQELDELLNDSESTQKIDDNTSSSEESKGEVALSEEHRQIYGFIRSAHSIHEEQLLSKTNLDSQRLAIILLELQFEGLIKQVEGARYIRTKRWASKPESENKSNAEKLQRAVGKINKFLQGRFHGLSRKYFQLYLSCCSYLMNTDGFCKWADFLPAVLRDSKVSCFDVNSYMTLNVVSVSVEDL